MEVRIHWCKMGISWRPFKKFFVLKVSSGCQYRTVFGTFLQCILITSLVPWALSWGCAKWSSDYNPPNQATWEMWTLWKTLLPHLCSYNISSFTSRGITLSSSSSSSYPVQTKLSLLCRNGNIQWMQCHQQGCRPQISLSSGGTLKTLPISNLAPATSCELGLYVPSDWRFFRAVMIRKNTTKMASNMQRVVRGMATTSQGMCSLCSCFCRRRIITVSITVVRNDDLMLSLCQIIILTITVIHFIYGCL